MHFTSPIHISRYDCPNNYNPSDFVMHISQTETQETLSEKGMFQLSAERERSLTGAIHHISSHHMIPILNALLSIDYPVNLFNAG